VTVDFEVSHGRQWTLVTHPVPDGLSLPPKNESLAERVNSRKEKKR